MAQLSLLTLPNDTSGFRKKSRGTTLGTLALSPMWPFWEFVPKCQPKCHAKSSTPRVSVAKCQSATSATGS